MKKQAVFILALVVSLVCAKADHLIVPVSGYYSYDYYSNDAAMYGYNFNSVWSEIQVSPFTQGQIDSKADSNTVYSVINSNNAATVTALAGKFPIPTGTTGQYVRGDGSLAATPVGTPGVNGTNPVIIIHSVSTVAYPGSATVTDTVTGITNSLDIQLPQGAPGTMGSTGSTGAVGADGALSIQRLRVQTDSSGNYTWTFGTAFGAGVTPIINAVAEGGTTSTINVQIVGAPTRTNCVFKCFSIQPSGVIALLGLNIALSPASSQAFIDLTAIAP